VTDYAIALKNGKTRYLQHLRPPRDDPTDLFRLMVKDLVGVLACLHCGFCSNVVDL